MPYIGQPNRRQFKKSIEDLASKITCKGDLNYVISELVGKWIIKNKQFTYSGISNAISAVHDAEIELSRRILAPYEMGKILINEDLESFHEILDALETITGKKVSRGVNND